MTRTSYQMALAQSIVSQGSFITSRLCTIALAKGEAQKRKSKASTRGEPLGFDQLKRGRDGQGVTLDTTPVRDADVKGLLEESSSLPVAERGAVLKACLTTSAGVAAAGFLLRQGSHFVAERDWPIPDCTVLMPYKTELWHVGPTVGVVFLVASLRQILMKVWPDFAKSSQAANNQVLGSLKPVDFFTVSYLSGISEELLFRGALLPLLGADWKGVVGAGVVFGVLHLTGGRNSSFAIWASFVGVVYGILGLYTSDLATSMAAHSAANLWGSAVWKLSKEYENSENLSKKNENFEIVSKNDENSESL